MNDAALKLALDDVQRMMRSDAGGSWPREDVITAALRADHAMNGGRYPSTDEVLALVTKDPLGPRAFTVLNTLIRREAGATVVEPNRAFFGSAAKNVKCHVRPRYSAGSGAMVDDTTALRVALDELRDYGHAMEGMYGEQQKKRAEALGLRGVAYAQAESGSGRKFRWLIQDLVTGECFRRLHDDEVRTQEYIDFQYLPQMVQEKLRGTALHKSDFDRTFWKYAEGPRHPYTGQSNFEWVRYQHELVQVEP